MKTFEAIILNEGINTDQTKVALSAAHYLQNDRFKSIFTSIPRLTANAAGKPSFRLMFAHVCRQTGPLQKPVVAKRARQRFFIGVGPLVSTHGRLVRKVFPAQRTRIRLFSRVPPHVRDQIFFPGKAFAAN